MITHMTDPALYTGMDCVFPQTPGRTDSEYAAFEAGFQGLSGIRLSLYKEKQMRRRINTLMDRLRFGTYKHFLEHLAADSSALAEFIDYITINVTEFFRTPEHWSIFESEMSAQLIHLAKRPLRIWSCACSTGEEVYSLAISMLKRLSPADFRIIATDIDEKVLEIAKAGVYPEQAMLSLPEDIADTYFVRQSRGWAANYVLRSCVEFRRLDLLSEEYPSACDLIVCRNVLIYFTDEAKDDIYNKFHKSLAPGGFLFTGNAEQIVYYKKYAFQKVKSFLYKKG